MNKRVAVVFVFVSLIALLFIEFESVNFAGANFIPPPSPNTDPPTLTVQSPQNVTTYFTSNITLSFSVTKPDAWFNNTQITRIKYTLDDGGYSILFGTEVYQAKMPNGDTLQKVTNFNLSLDNLSNGMHSLGIQVKAESLYHQGESFPTASMEVDSNVFFNVEAPVPSVSNLSIENKTYNTNEMPLSFNINETASEITYSLDNQTNVTINGNTTLTDLADGSHSIVIHAKDSAGNAGSSNVVFFTINTQPSPSPTPSPSSTPSQLPTQSPEPQSTQLPNEIIYAALGAAAILIVIFAVAVSRKRKQ